ncbi:MAG: hypothetical protein ABI091_16305, partial [Ferruginibacter sp.]
MKQIIFVLLPLLMLSCSHSAGSGDNPVASKSVATSASTTSGESKGTITCKMDGKSKTFQVQNGFFE